ncbi:MAG: alpha/beta fold hydrolase [Spirochaetota bacterium]
MTRASRSITAVAVAIAVLLLLTGCSTVGLQGGLRSERRLAGREAQYFEADGVSLHIRTAGNDGGGTDLLMLHGFLSHLHTWDMVVEDLPDCCGFVAYDRIGFGLSERPLPPGGGRWKRDETPYRSDKVLTRAEEVLLTHTRPGAVVVGHSAGASLALQLALQHPDHIQALVLISPALSSSGPFPLVRWFSQTAAGGSLVLRQLHSMAGDPQSLFQDAWYNPDTVPQHIKDQYVLLLSTENWDTALLEILRASERKNRVVTKLEEISHPVLIIHGRQDSIVPVEESRNLVKQLEQAQLVELDACGHVPQEEQPGVIAELLRGFLTELDHGK